MQQFLDICAAFFWDGLGTRAGVDAAAERAPGAVAYFGWLAVRPDARRRGVAAALVEAGVRRAAALGYRWALAYCTSPKSTRPAPPYPSRPRAAAGCAQRRVAGLDRARSRVRPRGRARAGVIRTFPLLRSLGVSARWVRGLGGRAVRRLLGRRRHAAALRCAARRVLRRRPPARLQRRRRGASCRWLILAECKACPGHAGLPSPLPSRYRRPKPPT